MVGPPELDLEKYLVAHGNGGLCTSKSGRSKNVVVGETREMSDFIVLVLVDRVKYG